MAVAYSEITRVSSQLSLFKTLTTESGKASSGTVSGTKASRLRTDLTPATFSSSVVMTRALVSSRLASVKIM